MMKSVRIEPSGGEAFFVSVQCDCGGTLVEKGEELGPVFQVVVYLDGKDVPFSCYDCGKRYLLRPQHNHLHVNEVQT